MGNMKNPQPKTVRTVKELAQYADVLGVDPSALISVEGELMLPTELRLAPSGPSPARPEFQRS